MLRASGEIEGNEVDVSVITGSGDGNVPHGAELSRFADAVMGYDDAELAEARDAVKTAFGTAGVIDTSAVISTFQKMDRFADSTGIPLDASTEMASRTMRAEIGLDEFGSARNTPAPGLLQKLGARVAGPLMPLAIKYLGPLTRRLAARRRELGGPD